MDRVVHADTTGTVKALGDKVKIDALPVQSLNKQYKNPSKYEIRPGFEHMEVTIDYNNYQINIWYQPKNTGMVANPNSVVTSGIKDEKEEVIEEEKAEIVEADEKEEIVEEEEKEEIVFFGMVWNQIWELLWDPEGNYRYWDFENDEFNYDTELIAVWEPITYTISYEWVDGLENSNPTEYTVETEAFDLIPLEKSWYTFEGWYTSEWNKVDSCTYTSYEWVCWKGIIACC